MNNEVFKHSSILDKDMYLTALNLNHHINHQSFIFSLILYKNNPAGVCPSLSWAKLWGLSNLRAPSMVWEGVRRSLIILHHHHSFDFGAIKLQYLDG